ncbi:MAG: hypothetical protein ACOH1E_10570, partial [Brevundimonas sp.]
MGGPNCPDAGTENSLDPLMTTYDYDLFVIGAGSGGVRAARLTALGG